MHTYTHILFIYVFVFEWVGVHYLPINSEKTEALIYLPC